MTNQENDQLKQILLKMEIGLNLLRDGREIPAHAKFQGVRDNIISFMRQSQGNENNTD